MAGRPKVLTAEQRLLNRRLSNRRYQENNRDKIRKLVSVNNNKYKNRRLNEKIKRKDPFYNGENNRPLNEDQKTTIKRMSELLKVGCIEKKTGNIVIAITDNVSLINIIG